MVTVDQVTEKLRECYDPEIPLNIVDLGLVYGVDVQEDEVRVRMTLTSTPYTSPRSTIFKGISGS